MAIRDREFPWKDDYPEVRTSFELERSRTLPIRWRRVEDSDWRTFLPGGPIAGGGEVILDFGREVVGEFSCELRSPSGETVRGFYGECLQEALCEVPSSVGWFTIQRDEWQPGRGAGEFRSRARRAFRFVKLKLPAGASCSAPSALHEHYPVGPAAEFECSDPLLNRAWKVCVETTRLCMQQYYEDGVKRDGMLWLGDYRVQYLCNAYAFGDAALARKCLFLAAASQCEDGSLLACCCAAGGHQHPHRIDCMPGVPFRFQIKWDLLNYSADFLCGLREYVLFSGDAQILDPLWPCVERLLAHFASVNWAEVEPFADFITDNCHPASGNGYHSRPALWFLLRWAMRDLRELCALRGGSESARALAERVQAALDPLIAGIARDARGLIVGQDDLPSWHTASMAALSGALPAESARALVTAAARADNILPTYAGFSRFYQQSAQFAFGDSCAALDSLRQTYAPVLAAGLTTAPESLRSDYSFLDEPMERTLLASLCHGWSAGGCFHLARHVLGVTPATPGFRSVRVRPQPGDLAWARGSVPTPLGEITVEWERKGSELRGQYTYRDQCVVIAENTNVGDGGEAPTLTP